MIDTDNGNAPPSGTTRNKWSTSAGITESLEGEVDAARAAMGVKFADLKASLQTAADPRAWAERHPWAAVGIAAATGFAAALAVGSSRKRRRRADRGRGRETDFSRGEEAAKTSGFVTLLFELGKIFLNSHLIPMFQAWQTGLAEQAAQAARQGRDAPGDARGHAPEAEAPNAEAAASAGREERTNGRGAGTGVD